eukprot:gene2337-2805_t
MVIDDSVNAHSSNEQLYDYFTKNVCNETTDRGQYRLMVSWIFLILSIYTTVTEKLTLSYSLENYKTKIIKKDTRKIYYTLISDDMRFLIHLLDTNDLCCLISIFDLKEEKFDHFELDCGYYIKRISYYQDNIYIFLQDGSILRYHLKKKLLFSTTIDLFTKLKLRLVDSKIEGGFLICCYKESDILGSKWMLISLKNLEFKVMKFPCLDDIFDVVISKNGMFAASSSHESFDFFEIDGNNLRFQFRHVFDFQIFKIQFSHTGNEIFIIDHDVRMLYCFSIKFREILFSFDLGMNFVAGESTDQLIVTPTKIILDIFVQSSEARRSTDMVNEKFDKFEVQISLNY